MVNNGFTRKKVGSLTLGEKLQKIRSEYRISLNEVAKNTKIQIKYLEYLENGEYEKLPADVYVRGFVRSYAHFLGADEQVLIRLYDRERNIQKNLKKEHFQEQHGKRFSFPSITVTPGILIGLALFIFISGGVFYLYREFRSFADVPYLVILEPTEGTVVEGNETFVRGKTDKDTRLSINGQASIVKDDGSFAERVGLQEGSNTLTVVAVNKFGKEDRRTLTIQARPAVVQTETPSEQPSDQAPSGGR